MGRKQGRGKAPVRGGRGGAAAGPSQTATSSAVEDAKKKEQGAMKLPNREDDLFKSVMKAFETKQFEKALSQADKILERFPYHGETLSMKGLALVNIDQDLRDEAFVLIKQGLAQNIRSSICWHVFGLFYRGERNFLEACKAYRNALGCQPYNNQILRDLPSLETQCRDFDKLVVTRKRLLEQQSNKEACWLAYIVALGLAGKHSSAIHVFDMFLENYLKSAGGQSDKKGEQFEPFQMSELAMFRADLLERAGQGQAAVEYLLEKQGEITDKYGLREKLFRLLLAQGKFAQAEKMAGQLIGMNPENLRFHALLLQAKQISAPFSAADLDALLQYYDQLVARFPRDEVPRRQPLEWIPASDPRFAARLDTYLRDKLAKGVPSLFRSISSLLDDPEKAKVVGELANGYLRALEASEYQKLPDDPEGKKHTPVTYLWTLAFLAQFYDRAYQPSLALHYIDRAIEHTPTILDFYVCKSKIYQHQGDLAQAAELYDFARQLDLADRNINTRCVKRLLRVNQPARANELIALFTREGDPPQNYLYDMQCLWFELETADAYLRIQDLGRALKKYVASHAHFQDFIFDQMDFHDYSIRRAQLNAYTKMLSHCDTVRSHPQFLRAVTGILTCYVQLHDRAAGVAIPAPALYGPPPLSKAELAKKQALQAAALRPAPSSAAGKKKKFAKQLHPVEKDPEGLSHLAAQPLAKAQTYLDEVSSFSKNHLGFQLAAFEVYIRMGHLSFLLAFQTIKRAAALDPAHPQILFNLCRLWSKLSATPQESLAPSPLIHALLTSQIALLAQRLAASPAPPTSIAQLNAAYLALHGDSLAHVLATARVTNLLDPSRTADFLRDTLFKVHLSPSLQHLQDCVDVWNALRSPADLDQAGLLDEFSRQAHELFPYHPLFKPSE